MPNYDPQKSLTCRSLQALMAKKVASDSEQSDDGSDMEAITKAFKKSMPVHIAQHNNRALLSDTASLISNSDIEDWDPIIEDAPSATERFLQEKIAFYQQHSKIDVARAINEYQQEFYNIIKLEHYLALCNYFAGDHAEINAYNRGELTTDKQQGAILQILSADLDQAIDTLSQRGCTAKSATRLYRVVKLPHQVVETLRAGEYYRPKQVLSVSRGTSSILKDLYFAEKCLSEQQKNVFFVIENSGLHAVDIQNISSHQEKEALFPRNSVFKITQTKQNGDFYQVYMHYEKIEDRL